MSEKIKLLLATTNQGKVIEYREMLKSLPVEVVSLLEAGVRKEVEETGATVHDNAVLKARTYAAMARMPAIADDSGLEVDALGGDPGVRSSRYAGEGASDAERNDFLLGKLKDVPDALRTARFRCVIAVATPLGGVRTSEGVCEGQMAHQSRGTLGFGYDPIFFLPGLGRHMAELQLNEKNAISHRGMAMLGARKIIEELASHNAAGASEEGAPNNQGKGLTHIDGQGRARMVDVSAKNETDRVAVAKGRVAMLPETIALVRSGQAAKGDVLSIAKVAGIMAAKRTSELIPLCHPLMLTKIDIELELNDAASTVEITATVKTTGKTGVEMEALTAVSVSALTVYDMCKAVDRGMRIEAVRLVLKTGGKSGDIVLE